MNDTLKNLIARLLKRKCKDVNTILATFTKTLNDLATAREELVSEAYSTDAKIAELRSRRDTIDAEINRADVVSDNLKSFIDGKNG